MLNRLINWCSDKMGRGKISLSKKIKDSVKSAVKYINDFEQIAAELAIDNGYSYVVCGHIHQPSIRTYENAKGQTTYLNSGDWIENLTSLEYHDGQWQIYQHLASAHLDFELEEPGEAVNIFESFENAAMDEALLLSKLIQYAKAG
jgi:UDP-2,3-diacylglucosamine pyrophosphatase LpxH